MWTRFMDMHSGGGQKEKFAYCYIEAPEKEAKIIFYNRFGHNPDRVTCTCCGNDYSIAESKTLEQATGYDRNCAWDEKLKCYIEGKGSNYRDCIALKQYLKTPGVIVIYASKIKKNERTGELPEQGYAWID